MELSPAQQRVFDVVKARGPITISQTKYHAGTAYEYTKKLFAKLEAAGLIEFVDEKTVRATKAGRVEELAPTPPPELIAPQLRTGAELDAALDHISKKLDLIWARLDAVAVMLCESREAKRPAPPPVRKAETKPTKTGRFLVEDQAGNVLEAFDRLPEAKSFYRTCDEAWRLVNGVTGAVLDELDDEPETADEADDDDE